MANRVINCSLTAFFSLEFSTSSRILETVDSSQGFVTVTRSNPVRFTQPLMMSSPTRMLRGRDSPVRAAVSSVEPPSNTVPSSGTRSPGFTTMTEPTATSSGSTVSKPFSVSRLAVSGRMSIRAAMEVRDLPTA